ncbi:MAG: hypothetical protein AVDCRST_MAG47-2713, partial [uncultured Nocardioidaceae bacterium]
CSCLRTGRSRWVGSGKPRSTYRVVRAARNTVTVIGLNA